MAESALNAADERRRAKEAYMQSLADMKGKAMEAQAATNSNNIAAAASQTQLTAAQKRELMLEEKRKNFFAKKSEQPPVTSESSSITPSETKPLHAAKDKFDLRQSNYEGELNSLMPVQQNNNFQEKESQNKPHPSEINLSEWKRKGYPSEYAYAKDVGLLDMKPKAQIEPKVPPKINENIQPRLVPDFALGQMQTSTAHGNVDINPFFTGHREETKVAKIQKQMEYAHGLQQQQQQQQQYQSKFTNDSGLQIGQRDADTSLSFNLAPNANIQIERTRNDKREQQMQQDFPAAHALPFGASDEERNAAKKFKQAEYARQLNEQAHFHNKNSNAPLQVDQQFEDKRGNQMQMQQQPSNSVGHALPFGASEEERVAAKKFKQAEYARQLNEQAQRLGPPAGRQQGNNQYNQQQSAADGGLFALGNRQQEQDALKKEKQAEYAAALMQQQQFQGGSNRRHMGNVDNYGQDSGGILGSLGAGKDNRDAKKEKQVAYARALEEQQQLQNVKDSNGPRGRRQQFDSQPSASSQLDPGWIIGPLGVPVRKTLETGNRGAQKAFMQQVALSPPNPSFNGGINRQSTYSDPYIENSQYDLPSNPPGAQSAMDKLAPNMDERAQQAKFKQAEQARAIEEQIREKKARQQKEKEERDKEELRELQRLEKERQQLQEQFEKEKNDKRQKAEEENKRLLTQQIEAKRLQKEQEEQKLRDAEQREEEKIRRESALLAEREQEEIRREKNANLGVNSQPSDVAISAVPPSSMPKTISPSSREDFFSVDKNIMKVSPRPVSGERITSSRGRDRSHLFEPESFPVKSPIQNGEIAPRGTRQGRQQVQVELKYPSSPGKHVSFSPRTEHHQEQSRPMSRQATSKLDRNPYRDSYQESPGQHISQNNNHSKNSENQGFEDGFNNKYNNRSRDSIFDPPHSKTMSNEEHNSMNGERSVSSVNKSRFIPQQQQQEQQSPQQHAQHQQRVQRDPQQFEQQQQQQQWQRQRPPAQQHRQEQHSEQYFQENARNQRPPKHNGPEINNHNYHKNSSAYDKRDNYSKVSDDSPGLDRTLDFDSRFIYPDGTILAASHSPSEKGKSKKTASSNRNELYQVEKEAVNSEADRILRGSQIMNGGGYNSSTAADCSLSSSSQSVISEFKDALQQLENNSTANTARIGTASKEEKRSSRFDVDGILRKNRRKLGILGRAALPNPGGRFHQLPGFSSDTDMNMLVENIKNVSSRPSSYSSSRPGTSATMSGLSPRAGSAGARQPTANHAPANVPKIPRLPAFSPRINIEERNEEGGSPPPSRGGYLDSYLANKGRILMSSRDGGSSYYDDDNDNDDNYSEYGL